MAKDFPDLSYLDIWDRWVIAIKTSVVAFKAAKLANYKKSKKYMLRLCGL